MTSYYASIRDFTADVARAVAAYAADMAVQNGYCAICRDLPRHGANRTCWRCEKQRLTETYPPKAPR